MIFGNRLVGNTESGIFLAGSSNVISANDIADNKWGVFFTPQLAAPHENKFYHNNFVNNTNNIYISEDAGAQLWDGGYSSGGNYWSDYASVNPNAKTVGNSDTWDMPYVISANNADDHPLIAVFTLSNATEMPAVTPPELAAPNSLVASWSFDTIEPSGMTPDETGNNPAPIGLDTGDISFTPSQVEGKFGKALSFNGEAYVSVPVSPSLEITDEITIDAWVNVQSFKNVTYNNILVKCVRTTASLPTRVVGLAVNGLSAENITIVPQGALIGNVYIQTEGLNEIATTEPVITLNQWAHVVFTRSQTTGMHIYVDGEEQNVTVTSGTINPTGSIKRENEIYIGHDSISIIDELSLRNFAIDPAAQPLWVQWWFWTALAAGATAALGIFVYFKKQTH